MPRTRRFYAPGLSVHVMNRGHNRSRIFDEDLDYELFLTLLRRAAARFEFDVHGFALMKNHFHAQITPLNELALSRAMKDIAQKYTAYYNRKHQSIGTVWNGRYKSVLIEDEQQWLRCLKYIDMNPVRAKIVEKPEDYRWTSYRVHGFGAYSGWLVDHPVFVGLGATTHERQAVYRAQCCIPFTLAEMTLQRNPMRLEREAEAVPA